MKELYNVVKRLPTIEEYSYLCREVGWTDYINLEVAASSIKHSLFGVVIEYEGNVVGMGRVIGDGYIYFYIQDIAITPDHQQMGLGGLIITSILDFLRENAPEKAFVGLFSSQNNVGFYNQFGINVHDEMTGMFGVVQEGKVR